jgi:hypothetical protein
MTIMANGVGCPLEELLADIAAINDVGAEPIRLVSPLMPGESRDLEENIRAQNRVRGIEAMVHATVAQILLDWCATATGRTCGEVIQRLALTLNDWLDEPAPPPEQPQPAVSA